MRAVDLALLHSVERLEVTREKKNAQFGENRITERSKYSICKQCPKAGGKKIVIYQMIIVMPKIVAQ